jgi:hypothetical protein
MSDDDQAMWKVRIGKSRDIRKIVMTWAEENLKKYAPSVSDDPTTYGLEVNTNRDFTLVERKKADLFYQRPDVTALVTPLFTGKESLLETHNAILDEKLGIQGVDAKALVHQVLFDILCTTGTGWTVMGYESATIPTPMDPGPTQPGAVLGLSQPPPQVAPVPVFEHVFWTWFGPKQALVPHDVHTTKADSWPWIGMEFEIPVRAAKRKGWVPDDFTGSASNTELYFDTGTSNTSAGDAVCHGVLIECQSALFRDDIVHPQHVTQIVFIEGVEDPVEYKDSPHQTLDQSGKLTPDSLIGYTFHPATLRVMSDSAFVPSDCTISRPTVNELNVFRKQMINIRDANALRWFYNTDVLPHDALDKIVRSPDGGMIGIPGEAFTGDGPFKPLPNGAYPRENFQMQEIFDQDLARTHALDAEQAGADASPSQTATESQIKQNNVNARLGLERGVLLDWYLRGVTKFSTLLQRYLPVTDAAAIVGQADAQTWDGWRHTIPAAMAFTALPDSQLRTDLASVRQRTMTDYTFLVNDPYINREVLLQEMLPKMGYSQKIINTQPPQPKPKEAAISLAIASASLNPMLPEYANLYQILTQQGVTGLTPPNPQAILNQPAPPGPTNGQVPHGGKLPQAEGLSKHASEITGGMPGTGQVVQ